MMRELRYGIEKRLAGATFEQAVEKVTGALKQEGFGVLTEIDVKDTLKKKLDVDFRRYVILGACNPTLAHRALGEEPQIGLLLPCNVVVQERAEGGAIVSIADPKAMFALVDNPAVKAVADEADERLRQKTSLHAVHGWVDRAPVSELLRLRDFRRDGPPVAY